MFGALPVVDFFLHLGSILLLTLKVTLPTTDADALISFAWLKTSELSAIVIVAVVDPAVKVIVV